MKLQNIASKKRQIYLFLRNEDGSQEIKQINNYYPYYYEKVLDERLATAKAYDGNLLKKIYVAEPSDIAKQKSINSYSADIKYTTNYLIDKIPEIVSSNPKYLFLDIEILANELPDTKKADCPIICVSIWNSATRDTTTWYIEDMPATSLLAQEKCLLEMVVRYIKKESPDIILIWNSAFDHPYLETRCLQFGIKYSKEISPIDSVRTGDEKDIFYPAGISIVDYMVLFKKVYMREQSYALDIVCQKYLNEQAWGKTDFSQLNERVRLKNANDVIRMSKLEDKFKLIPMYNEIRCLTKVEWESLIYNSRIVESLLLQEAKKRNIVLPNKPEASEIDAVYEGAYRYIKETGLFFNCGKADLESAYPQILVNFCLDSANIVSKPSENTITIESEDAGILHFEQNEKALLPTVVKKILALKAKYKKLKKENPNDINIDTKYAGIKSIVNSFYGAIALKYFRIFDLRVASSITYLVRDVLKYVQEKLEKEKISVLYADTDSLLFDKIENISDKLNKYIQEWAKNKYNKQSITLKFDFEGYFDSLFLLGMCHYIGRVHGKKDPEVRGIEAKRASSSKYEKFFQETLLNKILDKENRNSIIAWIDNELDRIKTLPIEEIGFPAKISSKVYKVETMFNRAYSNTKNINKEFKLGVGELFYYIFVKGNQDVLAFTVENKSFMKEIEIDYDKVIERAISNKTDKIFKAMNWTLPSMKGQLSLF